MNILLQIEAKAVKPVVANSKIDYFLVDTRECIKLPRTREFGSGDKPLVNFIRVKTSSEKRWRSFCAYSFHRNTSHRNAEGMLSMSPTYFFDAAISPLSLEPKFAIFFRLLISIKA